MTKRVLLILVAISAVTASVTAYYRNSSTDGQARYVTVGATRGAVVDSVNATGTLEAVTTVQVGTQVSGTIKQLYADYNSRVHDGQVIAELEPSLFKTQVDQAAATVVRLQADVERARIEVDDTQLKARRAAELWDKQLIARTDLETAESAARQAEASLRSAEAQVAQSRAGLSQTQVTLRHTVIRAPIDGIVISRNVDVGQTVAASTSAPTLFVIAKDLAQMRVNARVDEADIGRVAAGQRVMFTVDAYPRDTFTGVVSQVRLEPVTESNVVSYVTIIDVPNPQLKLKPGMTATVSIETARADDATRVPSAALRFRPARDGAQVWIVGPGGAPQAIPVRPGVTDGVLTALVDGNIPPNAEIITSAAAAGAPAASAAAGSPLIPRRPGGNRQSGAAQQGGER